jgi:hypothetical protein
VFSLVIEIEKHPVGEKDHRSCPIALVRALHPLFFCKTNLIMVSTTLLELIDNQHRSNVVVQELVHGA